MDQLKNTLVARVRDARAALAAARAAGDDYLAVVREGEIESLTLLAAEHDIVLPDDEGAPDHVLSLVDLEPRSVA